MRNIDSNIAKYAAILLAVILCGFCLPTQSSAQSGYQVEPIPDLWYNSVDGIRVGARILGHVPGSFGEGPHRLDAGIWLGTKFPDYPVSYYFSLTEPIPALSAFGSEANVNVESLFRTGFQQHGISFNKRWQSGFEALNYKFLSVGFRAEHQFEDDYLLYPELWQNEWLFLVSANAGINDENSLGRYLLTFRTDLNIAGSHDCFIRSTIALQQNWVMSQHFSLAGRLFTGVASNQTAEEYLFTRSLNSGRFWMNHGLSRARGTIPPSWVESGNVQFTGGANLRGYLNQDIELLNNGIAPLYTSLSAINLELDYPNPLDTAFSNISVVGEFINLRSYLFFDNGTSLGLRDLEETELLSDAGLGFMFSINIPDKFGNPRGLVLRYDIPLWLSHPLDENSFDFRSVFGIGAVISL